MKALAPGRASKDSSSSPSSCPPGCGHLSSASPSAARSLQLDVRADMNGCYDTLRRLVPTIPQDKKVSRVEILQHVIDYILELQRALDMQPALLRPPCGRCPSEAPRAPLVALNSVQFQVTSLPGKKEEAALCPWNAAKW